MPELQRTKVTPKERKAFEKRVQRFVDQSDRLTKKEARRLIQVVKDTRNAVIQDLRTLSPTEFRAFYLPTLRDRLTARLDELEARLAADMRTAQGRLWDWSVDKVDEGLERGGITMPTVFVDPATLEATQTLSAELVRTVPRNLLRKLSNDLVIGMQQQKGISEVTVDMMKDFDLSYYEAERIARTELLRTQSIVQKKRYDQVVEQVPEMKKRWIWSHKPEGRVTHFEAEVQYMANPIPYEEPFRVAPAPGKAKEDLQFPRDPAGSAGNIINCGCTWALVPPEVA